MDINLLENRKLSKLTYKQNVILNLMIIAIILIVIIYTSYSLILYYKHRDIMKNKTIMNDVSNLEKLEERQGYMDGRIEKLLVLEEVMDDEKVDINRELVKVESLSKDMSITGIKYDENKIRLTGDLELKEDILDYKEILSTNMNRNIRLIGMDRYDGLYNYVLELSLSKESDHEELEDE